MRQVSYWILWNYERVILTSHRQSCGVSSVVLAGPIAGYPEARKVYLEWRAVKKAEKDARRDRRRAEIAVRKAAQEKRRAQRQAKEDARLKAEMVYVEAEKARLVAEHAAEVARSEDLHRRDVLEDR